MAEVTFLMLFSLFLAMAVFVFAHPRLRRNPRAVRAALISLAAGALSLVLLVAYVIGQVQIDPNYRWPLAPTEPIAPKRNSPA
jgi:hypothetical protein